MPAFPITKERYSYIQNSPKEGIYLSASVVISEDTQIE